MAAPVAMARCAGGAPAARWPAAGLERAPPLRLSSAGLRTTSPLHLTHAALDAGIQLGHPQRAAAALARAAAGCAVSALALGGSSTAGHKLPRSSSKLYHARVVQWLREDAFHAPVHNITHLNAGTPAVGPSFAEKCLSTQMVTLPDIVFLEFAQNLQGLGAAAALERLIRRLLKLPTSPLVIIVDLPSAPSHDKRERSQHQMVPKLATHYNLPFIRFENISDYLDAHAMQLQWTRNMWIDCEDNCDRRSAPHPNSLGHEIIAAAIVRALRREWKEADSVAGQLAIPPPLMTRVNSSSTFSLFNGRTWHSSSAGVAGRSPNYELDEAVCVGPMELHKYVKHARGWAYVEEGTQIHPKPGFAISSSDSAKSNDLALCPDVTRNCKDPEACKDKNVLFAIGYLKSYDSDMGDAMFSCAKGCSCQERLATGYQSAHNSVTWAEWMDVRLTAAAFTTKDQCPCIFHIRAQPRNGTTRFRFKVSMMMHSHDGDMSWVDPWKTRWLLVGDADTRRSRLR